MLPVTPSGRRRFLQATGLALAAATGLGGCRLSPPLRVGLQPWCGYQFLWLAEEHGALGDGGITLQHCPLASDAIAALQAGEVQAAALTLDEVVRLRAQGMDLVVPLVFDLSVGADVVLARPEIRWPADLRGRRIGTEDSGLAAVMRARLLQAGGLAPDEVSVVTIGADHLSAWDTQSLDAVLTYEPALSALRARGLRPLFDSRDVVPLIIDVLAVPRALLEPLAGPLRRLVRGHFHLLERWRMNPLDLAHELAPRLRVPADEVAGVYRHLDLPDAAGNRALLRAPATVLEQAAAEIASILELPRPALQGSAIFTDTLLPEIR